MRAFPTVSNVRPDLGSTHSPVEPTLHLVDLENLCGGPEYIATRGSRVWGEYQRGFLAACDTALVAVSAHAWADAVSIVSSCPVFPGHGPDGADLVLMQLCDVDAVAARFGRVLIASGDFLFAFKAYELRQRGVRVEVVSRRGSLSRVLSSQVDNDHRLDLQGSAA